MGLLLYNFDYENPFAFFSDLKANDIRDGNMEVMLIRNMYECDVGLLLPEHELIQPQPGQFQGDSNKPRKKTNPSPKQTTNEWHLPEQDKHDPR